MTQQIQTLSPGEFIAFRIDTLKQNTGTVILGIVCGMDIDLAGLNANLSVVRSPKFKDGQVDVKFRRVYANPPELKDNAGAPLKRDGRFFVFDHSMEFVV